MKPVLQTRVNRKVTSLQQMTAAAVARKRAELLAEMRGRDVAALMPAELAELEALRRKCVSMTSIALNSQIFE